MTYPRYVRERGTPTCGTRRQSWGVGAANCRLTLSMRRGSQQRWAGVIAAGILGIAEVAGVAGIAEIAGVAGVNVRQRVS